MDKTHTKLEENIVLKAHEVIERAKNDKLIKVVESQVPYNPDIRLKDLSINAYGTDEDLTYASDKWFRSNIRRGNTVIEVHGASGKVEETFYARRGFEKFFDLMFEYMQYNLEELKDFDNFGIRNAAEHYELHDVIFGGARRSIRAGNKITVFKLVKANGENAQVGWVESLKAWVVASKNVSILVRNEEDLASYTTERTSFAKLIAKEWFRHVNRIEKAGLLGELKQYMNNKTFVGEYCGNQEYQHLVKYTEVDIHFVAAVDNNSNVTCLPPSEAFQIFEKFGLTHVKYFDMGAYDNWQAFNQALKKIYVDVSKATIDSEEEGSVIYLVETDKDGHQKTLSLSKMKTLEYRIYRKLREKLKNFMKEKNTKPWREFYKKFQQEVQDLCKEAKPPTSLGFYGAVAREAFEFAEKHGKKSGLIHDQYISFLSLLMHEMSQGKKLDASCFNEENIKKIMPIPWTEYTEIYKGSEELPTSHEDLDKPKEAQNKQGKKVYILIPMGIPGMGKTYFLASFKKYIEENHCKFSMVSSDDTRKECMDKMAKANKKLTKDELFAKTATEARNLFNERLGDLIFKSDKVGGKAHFIYIDKNHPPNAVPGTLKVIRENSTPALDISIIALTPLIEGECLKFDDHDKKIRYPFSANFFFNCLDRVQNRSDHQTLSGNGAQSAGVMMTFFNLYRNVRLNHESIVKNGFHKVLSIPFTNELEKPEIPEELLKTFIKIIRATKVGDQCDKNKHLPKFMELYEGAKLQFKYPEPSHIEESVKKFFEHEIVPELPENYQPVGVTDNFEESKVAEDKHGESGSQYNPEKLPVYLGLFTVEDEVQKIKDYIVEGLDLLIEKYQDPDLIKAKKELKGEEPLPLVEYSFVADPHVTTLFIGNDKQKRLTESFKTFRPGHKGELSLVGYVIVPNKIITAICYPDQSVIKIENKFPHMTLMTGKWKPKNSNDLFEALFGHKGKLKDNYVKKEFDETMKITTKVGKDSVPAYLVFRPKGKEVKLQVEAREFNN